MKAGWATAKAARYAVMTWHYSKTMPIGKVIRVGIWDDENDDAFCGVVLFARGAAPKLGVSEGFSNTQCCELVRVALGPHENFETTQAVAMALRFLKQSSPNLLAVYSYADTAQGHHGGIYQGGNWVYLGQTSPAKQYLYRGRWTHPRALGPASFDVRSRKQTTPKPAELPSRVTPGKHKYVIGLRRSVSKRLAKLAQPYPKACTDAPDMPR